MPYTVSKVEVWTREIDDRPGSLAAALKPLADVGVDLSFLIARRYSHLAGKGVIYLGGVSGAKAVKAAETAGLKKTTDLAALRVEGPNMPGDCYRVASRLAEAGVNLRGVSAGVIDKKYVLMLAFDSAADADTAARLLRAAGKGQ
jgi:hypothetical protein